MPWNYATVNQQTFATLNTNFQILYIPEYCIYKEDLSLNFF